MGDIIVGAVSGAAIACLVVLCLQKSIEHSAIKACEFNSERLAKCEYVRTAMPIPGETK